MDVKNTEPAYVDPSQELRDRFAGGNKGDKLASTSVWQTEDTSINGEVDQATLDGLRLKMAKKQRGLHETKPEYVKYKPSASQGLGGLIVIFYLRK